MKRLWRWLFNLAAGVSLLLCMAWMVIWFPLSPIGWNFWEFPHRPGDSYPAVYPQTFGLAFAWVVPPQHPPPGSGFRHFAGFHVQWFQASVGFMRVLVIPSWFGLPSLALVPLYWTWLRLRSKWQPAAGFCQVCGYDLRATPNRCPECGTVTGQSGQ